MFFFLKQHKLLFSPKAAKFFFLPRVANSLVIPKAANPIFHSETNLFLLKNYQILMLPGVRCLYISCSQLSCSSFSSCNLCLITLEINQLIPGGNHKFLIVCRELCRRSCRCCLHDLHDGVSSSDIFQWADATEMRHFLLGGSSVPAQWQYHSDHRCKLKH